MEMEEGKVYVAVLFAYADGFMFRWTPGGIPVQAVSNLKFDTAGPMDEFGVRPHEHTDVQLSEATSFEGRIDFLAENAKVHGPPQSMSTVLFKKVGRYVVQLFAVPPSPYGGQSGYIVSAVAPQDPSEPSMTAEKLEGLARDKATLPVTEHDHWFASEKPLPFSGALWIFQSVTEANILATNCNCEPALRPRRPDAWAAPVDESFVGDDLDLRVATMDEETPEGPDGG